MKKIVKLAFIALATLAFAVPLSMSGIPLLVAATGVSIASMINPAQGSAMSGLNQEIWSDVLVEQFRTTEEASFLNEIPDESHWVTATRGENEVINLTDIGADPEVLINNTSYPIGIQSQTDSNITINLDKYQTKATSITDDEIKYIAYDKIGKVVEKHTAATERTKHNKAIHALAPASDTANTPVLVTTGTDDGTGRNKMILKDLLALKRKFDDQKIPLAGRVLVLGSDHYNDLLEEAGDKPLFTNGSLADSEGGLLSQRLYGFKVYWYVETPYFAPTTKTKVSFGAIPSETDRQASIAFYAPDMFRANGSTKLYTSDPEPLNQRSLFNLRHYYIVLPRKQRAIGAIVSGNSATPTPASEPEITSLIPNTGEVDSSLAIIGTDFTGTTSVKFGVDEASFVVVNDNLITATVPSGISAAAYDVKVTTPVGTSVAETYTVTGN